MCICGLFFEIYINFCGGGGVYEGYVPHVCGACCCRTTHVLTSLCDQVITDPVELWSSPDSQARAEKDYFDDNFGLGKGDLVKW